MTSTPKSPGLALATSAFMLAHPCRADRLGVHEFGDLGDFLLENSSVLGLVT